MKHERVYLDRDQLENFAMNCVGGVVTMKQIHEFPGVHVPPHGRLIDERDILKNQHDVILKNGAKHRCFDTTMLSEIQTIIPAEEGE